ncbi:hypothetical protein DRN58_01790 [Thermococci archaeon]|nr:MAG: hypothetical protein DRN58_01790 [Thermococci archaeon]
MNSIKKEINEEFYNFTPKRKSILWYYDSEGNARILSIRSSDEKALKDWFDGILNRRSVTNELEGEVIKLNKTGTAIWELCNGVNTIQDIIKILSKSYKISEKELKEDLISFLEMCKNVNLIDLEWRCIE